MRTVLATHIQVPRRATIISNNSCLSSHDIHVQFIIYFSEMASPKLLSEQAQLPIQTPHKIHDPNVSFEEYLHFAQETRAWENNSANTAILSGPTRPKAAFRHHFGLKEKTDYTTTEDPSIDNVVAIDKVSVAKDTEIDHPVPSIISDDEWETAARAGRTATWGAVFFLLTTDILGPFPVP